MKVDGKAIAQSIFEQLTKRVEKLQEKNIVPQIAIILLGDDPASVAYVGQKVKKAEIIKAKATVISLPDTTTQKDLIAIIEKLNRNTATHGIIVQRPLPQHINSDTINLSTNHKKDIDAFQIDSPYNMPLALAVLKILSSIFKETKENGPFENWLQSKTIAVIGKGETGGRPIIKALLSRSVTPIIIDSKTINPERLTKQADIIISTVGKTQTLTKNMIKQGVILIGVGMQKGADEKLHADYEERDIQDIASFYTPVPGGVGPVNVAMLLENLVDAAEKNHS